MGHPNIENRTPFAAETLFLVDEELRPLVVPIIKGTFLLPSASSNACVRAEHQETLSFAGEFWGEIPEASSYKFEPEVAFFKPTTDVVLVGQAHAPRVGTTEMDVRLSVGPVRKELRVFGERMWIHASGTVATTRPISFESIPLVYERAFGGWDRSDPDARRHTCDARNPVGTGFAHVLPDAGMRLPNIEDPRALVRRFGDRPAPTGVGFVSPHWQPRAALAGTYDAAWQADRAPRLARDFKRAHLNAASEGLVAPQHLLGTEYVTAEGVTRGGPLRFALPGVYAPRVKLTRHGAGDVDLVTNLDTVILEPDAGRMMLIWRTYAVLRTGPHDLISVVFSPGGMSS